MVVQIGNRDTNCLLDKTNRERSREVYTEFSLRAKRHLRQFHFVEVVIHNDEYVDINGKRQYSTPHMHIAYVPWADGYKRGMSKQSSLSGALKQMGYVGDNGKADVRELNKKLNSILTDVMREHGIERLDMGNTSAHRSVRDFKAHADEISMGIPDKLPDKIKEHARELIDTEINLVNQAAVMVDGIANEAAAEITYWKERADWFEANLDYVIYGDETHHPQMQETLQERVKYAHETCWEQYPEPRPYFGSDLQAAARAFVSEVKEQYENVVTWLNQTYKAITNPIRPLPENKKVALPSESDSKAAVSETLAARAAQASEVAEKAEKGGGGRGVDRGDR
jgi:hypothetical protein